MMDNKTRNYVIECERITGDVWSPLHMFVDASVAAPVVRCEDCHMFDGAWCELMEFAVPHMSEGFCAWGIVKTGNKNP